MDSTRYERYRRTAGARARPFRGEGLGRRVAPLALALVCAFALALDPSTTWSPGWMVAAGVANLVTIASALGLATVGGPRLLDLLPPIGFLSVLTCLRLGANENDVTQWTGPFAALLIAWVALNLSRGHMIASFVSALVLFAVPTSSGSGGLNDMRGLIGMTLAFVLLMVALRPVGLRAQRAARVDELTGALTRETLFIEFERELSRAARTDTPLTLVAFDVHGTMQLRGERGHSAGDRALRALGEGIPGAVRDTDITGRFGPLRFLCLLPSCHADEAPFVVRKLARAADAAGLAISAGIATWDGTEADVALLQRSLDALERADDAGSNRMVHARAAG